MTTNAVYIYPGNVGSSDTRPHGFQEQVILRSIELDDCVDNMNDTSECLGSLSLNKYQSEMLEDDEPGRMCRSRAPSPETDIDQ